MKKTKSRRPHVKVPKVPELLQAWKSRTTEQRKALAKQLGTSYIYLAHVTHGRRRLGWENAQKYATALDIPVHKLRPDIWAR